MGEIRLGDIIDDFCIKCRRLTNHAVVSIIESAAAKVRCRTCYNDHDYRHEQIPPSKRDLKKAALFKEVLSGVATAGVTAEEVAPEPSPEPVAAKKPTKKKQTAEATD